jgi:GAF domain-containing protein
MGQEAVVSELRPQPPRGEGASTAAYHAAISAFSDVAAALSELRDQDTLLHLIAKRICELTKAPRCSVYLRDEETGLFRGQVGHADRDIDPLIKRLTAGTEADRFTHEIVQTRRPVLVSDALEDPRPIRSTMRAWHVRSMLGVPMVLRGEVIGLVFLDAEDRRCAFGEETIELASTFADLAAVAIAQAQMTSDLRRSLTTVARQNKLLRRASAVDDRLGKIALDGADFVEIAEAVADLTAKPCAIYDAGHHVLARSAPTWNDAAGTPRMPDAATWGRDDVQAAVAALGDHRGGVLSPMPEAGLSHRFLVAPVITRDKAWGTLVVMEHGTRFGSLDAHIARRAATHIALEMSAERRAARAEWDARATLLGELLRGNRDLPSLERRASYLGTDLDVRRVLCLVATATPGDGPMPSATAIADAFDAVADDKVLVTGVAEGVAVALDLVPDAAPRDAILEARRTVERGLAEVGGDHRLVASLSAVCGAPEDYVRAYREVKQVMTCLTTLADGGTTRVLSADDLGPGRLFLASADRAEAERFARDALGPLLGDDDGMADLLKTLRVFFDNSRSVRRSAQQLGVHENTIRYRLARVEELTGLAVASDSEDQLTVQFSLLILRLTGWEFAPLGLADEAAAETTDDTDTDPRTLPCAQPCSTTT